MHMYRRQYIQALAGTPHSSLPEPEVEYSPACPSRREGIRALIAMLNPQLRGGDGDGRRAVHLQAPREIQRNLPQRACAPATLHAHVIMLLALQIFVTKVRR